MQFLTCSLAALVGHLKKEADFTHLRHTFPTASEAELLMRNGVYPYDYMDSMARFGETRLPSKEQFYNRLNDEHVSDADYAHAQRVWTTFECATMRDYHDLYLKADVLLLADIFEKFRVMSLDTYSLDPVHYYSLPRLSWEAAMRYSWVKLNLVVDIVMYPMMERVFAMVSL